MHDDEVEGSGDNEVDESTFMFLVDGSVGEDDGEEAAAATIMPRQPSQIIAWRKAAAALLARRSRAHINTLTPTHVNSTDCAVDIGKCPATSFDGHDRQLQ